MNTTTIYDKKKEYQATVAPLVKKLDALCKELGIPYFFAAAVKSDEEDTEYINEGRSPITLGYYLKEDIIVDHLKLCSGFRVIIPEELPDLEL